MVKSLHPKLLDKLMTAPPNVLIIDHKFLALLPSVFENEYEFFALEMYFEFIYCIFDFPPLMIFAS
jgi:hypothetical protein